MARFLTIILLALCAGCTSVGELKKAEVVNAHFKALAGCTYLSMLMEYPDIKMRELDDQSAIEVARKTSGAQLFRAVFVDVGDGSTELQIIGSKETPAELVRAYVQDCTPA